MARGDRKYCRGAVDWISDNRCEKLGDNDTRWLLEVLRRLAVSLSTPVIPAEYTASRICDLAHISPENINRCLATLCDTGLIGISKTDCLIVVHDIVEEHNRMTWEAWYPEEQVNPWFVNTEYRWSDCGHVPVPVSCPVPQPEPAVKRKKKPATDYDNDDTRRILNEYRRYKPAKMDGPTAQALKNIWKRINEGYTPDELLTAQQRYFNHRAAIAKGMKTKPDPAYYKSSTNFYGMQEVFKVYLLDQEWDSSEALGKSTSIDPVQKKKTDIAKAKAIVNHVLKSLPPQGARYKIETSYATMGAEFQELLWELYNNA